MMLHVEIEAALLIEGNQLLYINSRSPFDASFYIM